MWPFYFLFDPIGWVLELQDYAIDSMQRSILFWDIMRRRGNNYLDHLHAGQPPVLVFDYETILDARTFERPVNYALVKIKDRRSQENRRNRQRTTEPDRGRRETKAIAPAGESPARPIVVIDPRAGHGPGIGGSKLNSQVGVAMDLGHPVYFVMFFTDPEPDQTISDVHDAEIRFLEEVARRHPGAPKPAVIGNCQAGWAAALVAADRPDVTGPMVLSGSPLSYWGGVEGANPMRYRGGLSGGVWMTSLWCDLGNGRFDGALLVAGFEDLNPANTLWSKQYRLYANVDTEAERYLGFEKWWGGFFKMNTEEIHYIVDSLFVGNELEQGSLRLDNGKPINLKNFKQPILVFASSGDNITPPPQALNWIYKVYGTVEEIKRCGQVIIYMVHGDVGHLGIFVSGQVARKEHRQIIGCMDMIEYLAPGLYEMVIEGEPSRPWLDNYRVRFEERGMQDLLAPDDGLEEEEAFYCVRTASRLNDLVYRTWVRPWVRMGVNELGAEWLRNMHGMRVQRYVVSNLNPLCWLLPWTASVVNDARRPAGAENRFRQMETIASNSVETALNGFRDVRDLCQEALFKALYANPWARLFSPPEPAAQEAGMTPRDLFTRRLEMDEARQDALNGGFAEAVVRILIALGSAAQAFEKERFDAAGAIIREDPRLRRIRPAQYKAMAKKQARILQLDKDLAMAALPGLLPDARDRRSALDIARRFSQSRQDRHPAERVALERIESILSRGD